MPKNGDRSTHAPTKTREDLATALALTVKGNAAVVVQDAEDVTNGVAIFCKLAKVYGQSDGDGMAYPIQLKQFSFYEAGYATVFASKFVAICNEYSSTTGSEIPGGSTDISAQRAPHARHHRYRWRDTDIERTRRAHTTVPEPHVVKT